MLTGMALYLHAQTSIKTFIYPIEKLKKTEQNELSELEY